MKVLSLFDGISCARVSLERAGIQVETYSACEIEKNAIKISQKNYPEIVRLGDVRTFHTLDEDIDLLIGGSPCIDLSIAKRDRKGLEGEHSSLFWEYIRILRLVKPKYFILENVASMPKKDKDIITKELGVEPVMFNASLVSAQCRKRLFWTNIQFELPEDKGILLKDILEPDGEAETEKSYCLTSTYHKVGTGEKEYEHNKARGQRTMVRVGHIGTTDGQANRVYSTEGKSVTLSANGGGLGAKTGLYEVKSGIRKLTPIECERLQGLPDNYTDGIAKTHRYKCLGNAFNVDVIAHILSSIK